MVINITKDLNITVLNLSLNINPMLLETRAQAILDDGIVTLLESQRSH